MCYRKHALYIPSLCIYPVKSDPGHKVKRRFEGFRLFAVVLKQEFSFRRDDAGVNVFERGIDDNAELGHALKSQPPSYYLH